jgi:DNA-binding IclR family transcriptional regulator
MPWVSKRAIRDCGFATNDEEYELESCGVAAPIRDAHGGVIAALASAVPKHRFSPGQQPNLARLLCDRARDISRRLGYDAL